MVIYSFLSATLLFSWAALAATDPAQEIANRAKPQETPYQTLERLYLTGSAASLSDFSPTGVPSTDVSSLYGLGTDGISLRKDRVFLPTMLGNQSYLIPCDPRSEATGPKCSEIETDAMKEKIASTQTSIIGDHLQVNLAGQNTSLFGWNRIDFKRNADLLIGMSSGTNAYLHPETRIFLISLSSSVTSNVAVAPTATVSAETPPPVTAVSIGARISYTCYFSHSSLRQSLARCDLKAHEGSIYPAECIQIIRGSRNTRGGVLQMRVIKEGQGSAIEYAYVPAPYDTSRAFENLSGANIVGKITPQALAETYVLNSGPVKADVYALLDSQAVTTLDGGAKISVSCATQPHTH